jgi:hypothetical protein
VERAAHRDHPHGRARPQRPEQVIAIEVTDPRPEPDERRTGDLRLQADEMLEHAGDGRLLTFEQELPCEQRAVELAGREGAAAAHTTSKTTRLGSLSLKRAK